MESCDDDWSERRVRIELPDGRFFYQKFGQTPTVDGPNSLRIEQWTDVGPASVIQDNSARVDEELGKAGGGVINSGCACSSSGAGSAALLTFVLGVFAARRRRSKS
jgi:MYXO-CTERM domain-containing protein